MWSLIRCLTTKNAVGGADTVIDDSLVLTVTVSNVNEAGTVSISGDPEAGSVLTASLTDPDGAVSSLSWQWSKAVSSTASFTNITSATSASYTVDVDDIAMVLKATVTYTDTVHSATNQTAESEATAEVGAGNSDPQFADADSNNTADPVTLTVAENTTSGNVGSAVTAVDPDTGDVLTYSVAAGSNSPADTGHLTAFNRDFSVNAATGQVTVKADAVIDFESRASYVVSYQVSDKKNAAGGIDTVIDDSLVLTVTVTNVNDAGTVSISGDPEAGTELTASLDDPDGAVSSLSWQWSKAAPDTDDFTDIGLTSASYTAAIGDIGKILKATATYTDTVHAAANQTESRTTAEVEPANRDPQFADADSNNTADRVTLTVAENTTSGNVGSPVTAVDPNSDALTYSVAATTDFRAAAHLTAFNRDFSVDAATGQVTVKVGAVIDFESRASYVVSYQVSDKKNAAGGIDTVIDDSLVLTVAVTNVNEDGTVSISGDPEAGSVLTASLTDPDGVFSSPSDIFGAIPSLTDPDEVVSSLSWQWSKAASGTDDFSDIASATSASYTVDEGDVGEILKATVTYTDTVHSAAGQKASADTAEVGAGNSDPQFADTNSDNTADPVTLTVAENTTSGNVGSPVTAVDPNSSDALTYSVAATTDPGAAGHLTAFNRDFALDAATGRVTVKADAVIDFESRASYVVSYRVFDKKNAKGGADDVIDDTLVLTVTVTNVNEAGTVSISGDPKAGSVLTASLTDPDGPVSSPSDIPSLGDPDGSSMTSSLSWQWSKAASGTSNFSDIASATSASYTVDEGDVGEILKATVTYTDTVHSAAGQKASADTAEIGAANSDPQFADTNSDNTADPVTLTVAENTTSGNVGSVVTATDPDAGDVLAYSVAAVSNSQTDTADLAAFNEDFSFDAATGQVTVKADAVIDFESRASYVVSYRVSDKKNARGTTDAVIDDTLVLTVTVSNLNEAGDVSISGDPEAGTELTASLTDPDGAVSSLSWQWSKAVSSTASFTNITSATSASYTVDVDDIAMVLKATVTYTDTVHSATNQTAESEATAEVGAANAAPAFAGIAVSRTVEENTTSGNVGSAVTATDPDAGDVLAYSVAATTDPGAAADLAAFNEDFAVDAATGRVAVKVGAVIDFESRTSYVVSYRVSDNKDAAGDADTVIDDTLVLTVTVSNLNEVGNVSISGDPEAGTELTASLTDPDGAVSGVSWVWAVGASSSGSFTAVSGATAASFTVRAADHGKYLQATATYTDTVHSATGQTVSEVTAEVGAANAAPVFAGIAVSRMVEENTTSGNVGSVVTATDPDAGDVLAYSVAAVSNSPADTADLVAFNEDFTLDAATGRVTVKVGAVIDFESRAGYVVSYRVSDNKDAAGDVDAVIDDTLVLTVTVTNLNEAGTVSISGDPEAGTELTASLTDPDGKVSSLSWQWSKAASGTSNFSDIASATSASYTVKAVDVGEILKATVTYADDTHSATKQTASEVTAEVGAANAAPAFAGIAVSRTVEENTTSGNVGSVVTATDPDAGDVLAYSVAAVSNSPADTADLVAFNEDFSVNAATGRVTVKVGAVIDFESRAGYVVSYRVSDNKDAAGDADTVIDDTLVLTVTVSNLNEDGDVSISGDPEAGTELTASLTDPDGAVSSLSWQWSKAVSSTASFTNITSATSASYTVDVDDIAMVLKATVTYTDTVHSATNQTAESEATAEVGAANAAPAFAGIAVSRMVEENTTSGNVGSVVTATDPDAGDVLAYSVAAVSNSQTNTEHLAAFNEDFTLDAATGQVTVKADAVIDFESRASYVVSYRVSDKKDAAGDVDAVIDDTLVLTVTVTNLNEVGNVSISGDPEAGTELTASLTDPDGAVSGVSWVWAVGASSSGSFTAVSGATAASFTVRAADHGKYLQATA